MPGLGRQYYDYCDDKIDILTQLQEYGVEYLVYDILHKLTVRDICSAFQVCSGWNQWDNAYFWSKELQTEGVRVVRYDPETKLMFTGSYDGCVKVWDGNWNLVRTLEMAVAVTDIAFLDTNIFVTGDEGVITCFNSQNSAQRWTVTGGEMVNCIVVWEEALVTGSDAGNLDVRSQSTGHG